MKTEKAFTLLELLITAVILSIVTAVGFRSMAVFTEQRRLRTAAIELSGYLQVARSVAGASNAPCSIALSKTTGGVFTPDSTPGKTNSCKGTIPEELNIGGVSGSSDLEATVIGGSFPITFTPQGTIRKGATVLVSSAKVPIGGWCVNVMDPLATVRLGWQPTAGSCNYAIEQ